MLKRLRLPSPAMAVALIALFVALSGTATAAQILVTSSKQIKDRTILGRDIKTNQIAPNHLKKAAKTQIANIPSPASTARSLVVQRVLPITLGPDALQDMTIGCQSNERAIAAGWDGTSFVAFDSRPTSETTWTILIGNDDMANAASGNLYVVCLR